MGLLGKELPASDFWPRSFSSKKNNVLQLNDNAFLGEEQIIDFNLQIIS